MSSVALGAPPIPLTVYLTNDGDFNATLTANPAWPDNADIELRFATADDTVVDTWPATITGADAVWAVPAVDVAAIITAKALKASVHYTTSTVAVVWMRGRAEIA